MIKMIAKLLKVINSETDPGQISLAFCLAMVAGLTPLNSLHNLFIFLLVLLLRVNISAFILGLTFFTGAAYLLDPLFHQVGLGILTAGALQGLWTSLYNITLFRLAKFNNSILLGSLFVSVIAFVPLYLLLNLLIRKYREHILAWVQKTRIMQLLKTSRLYSVYQAVSGWGGQS
ncbi:MAG: TIGR03546 family protein [Thermodesulfobacteriota bacterium]